MTLRQALRIIRRSWFVGNDWTMPVSGNYFSIKVRFGWPGPSNMKFVQKVVRQGLSAVGFETRYLTGHTLVRVLFGKDSVRQVDYQVTKIADVLIGEAEQRMEVAWQGLRLP